MGLTAVAIKAAKGRDKPYKLTDGDGLFLYVTPKGGRYWRMNYRHLGKQKTLAFGVWPDTGLADAREQRDTVYQLMEAERVSEYVIKLPDDFDAYAWEVEAKGWFADARVSLSGKEYRLAFYDPVRLAQEIASEHENGCVFYEPNLIVVKTVTQSAMQHAVDDLVKSGRVNSLFPE